MGMVLPVAGLFALGSDLVHRGWPGRWRARGTSRVSLAVMGVMVLLLAPAFVRIAWPTRSLPPARCVTGSNTWPAVRVPLHRHPGLGHQPGGRQRRGDRLLPWFRYVL